MSEYCTSIAHLYSSLFILEVKEISARCLAIVCQEMERFGTDACVAPLVTLCFASPRRRVPLVIGG